MDLREQLTAILNRKESVQVVSLPGMGASRLTNHFTGLVINSNLFSHATGKDLISIVSESPERDLIILDSLDRLVQLPDSLCFFNFLKGLRDQHKYQLRYLFLTRGKEPIPPSSRHLYGDLYTLISENILYLTPIPEGRFPQEISEKYSPVLDFFPTSDQIHQVYRLSGGIPSLVKVSLQAMRDYIDLNLQSHPRLKAQLEDIRESLGNSPDPHTLSLHGLTDTSGQLISSLLKDYLLSYSNPVLTAAETRLLELLKSHLGQLVSKDQICTVVYPDVKNASGISDHAIDQLIHRLREKISSRYTLTTHRGQGYTLKLI